MTAKSVSNAVFRVLEKKRVQLTKQLNELHENCLTL